MPRRNLAVLLCAAAALASGCSKDTVPDASRPPMPPARTLPLPAESPTPSPSAGGGALVWQAPSGWTAVPPASSMRRAQYRLSGPGGEGECAVYYFGPGQGGDARANAERWAGQFEQPGGGSSLDVMRISRLERTAVPVQLVEVTGTYDGGMTMTEAPAEKKPGYMLLGGIAQGPDAAWFFKLTGPEATVRAERDAFVRMMESIRPGD